MTKLFSVARLSEPSQPRPAVYAGRAEHIAALVARKPAPAPEHIAADPSPSPAAPEPWWREMRRQRSVEVFGMAVRGEFPDRLPLESIIALASLTLDGVCAPQDLAEIRKRVDSMLAAGLLQPGDDHLFGHKAVRAVLPMLALPEGTALAAWLGAEAPAKRRGSGAETKAVNRAATVQEARTRDAAAQPWAQEWQRTWQPVMRVLGGAQLLGKLGELMEGCEFQFATTDLIAALRKWDETGKWGTVPKRSGPLLARALRGFAPDFTWLTGNRGSAEEKEQRISLLLECYQIGKEADDDEELGGLLDSAGLGPLLRVA